MPLDLHVIRASEFVCLDADERLDFEASKKALHTLAQACRKRGLDCALLDLRSLSVPVRPVFTPKELAALVGTFHEAGFGRQQRLAVLYRIDPHGGARKFAFIGRLSGWQVRAFSDFEAAFLWLSEGTTRRAGSREGETPIPITKRSREAKKLSVDLMAEEPGASTTRSKKR